MSETSASATPASIQLYRVRFTDSVPAGLRVLREFTDPCHCFAVMEPLASGLLPDAGRSGDEFYFLFLPGGSAVPYDLQKRGEEWMSPPDRPDAAPTVEIVMRSDRILWRPGRSLMQGAPDRMDEVLLALADFSFYELELRRLEDEISADRETVEKDAPLTTADMTSGSLASLRHAADMASNMTRRRLRFARLEPRIEHPSATLPPAARRLGSELLTQTEVLDRIEAVDDRLEVYEDLYELANDRLSEYRYWRSEALLEIGIVVILLVEVVLIIWEIAVVS